MKKFLDYDEIQPICNEINEKHIPTEDAFIDKVDELFENVDLEGYDFITHAFKELLKIVDSEINKIENQVQISPSCQKGCANCCYFPIITTRLEAKLMIGSINQLPADEKEKIIDYLNTYFKTNEKQLRNLSSINIEQEHQFKHSYISNQLPCPMLNLDTNSCMAYDIRPIPCRTYLNYSNPDVCKENLMPKEPFSYEFLREFYIEALNEVVQTVLYEENETYGIQYPDDLFEVDYLPKLLKVELASKIEK